MLESVAKWNPFRIDALGLVTMIGAEEIDRAVGRLIDNPIVGYLPFLGAYVIAGNRFVQPVPGVVLYNVTDGIMATDVAGWLSRWLLKQKLNWNTTKYTWEICDKSRFPWEQHAPAAALGIVINFGLLVLTVLVRDWFGFANTIAMVASVVVRVYLVQQNRRFLDRTISAMTEKRTDLVKTFCILADGKAVTLLAARGVVTGCFLTTPRPVYPRVYNLVRAFGWLGFAAHVICIGQSTLFIQIVTVVIMIVASVLCVLGVGSNESRVSRRLCVSRTDTSDDEDRRTVAYARLDLTEEEENTMLAWGLLPQKSNERWWNGYRAIKNGSVSTA